MNEVILACHEKIVSKQFFEFLSGNKSDKITFKDFPAVVDKFRQLCMLKFGSFRFAYDYLCNREDVQKQFPYWTRKKSELLREFTNRSEPIQQIEPVASADLHLLGHLIPPEVPEDTVEKVQRIGERNFETYLTYDYMDVYVATSMRKKWEFEEVNRLCKKVFDQGDLKKLKVRYFNPTLNFHHNSIAKSLIEGLMLRRCKCTLYLVQENDTMGKDSEMASTLAQGKPVIAYLPSVDVKDRTKRLLKAGIDELLYRSELLNRSVSSEDLPRFKECAEAITKAKQEDRLSEVVPEIKEFAQLLAKTEATFFDNRANELINKHPLRFQVELKTGVANGVLITRSFDQCANVIYRVLTNDLKFDIIKPGEKLSGSLESDPLNFRLVEESTGCAFRVVTEDEKLTNSFWNLYKCRD